MSINGDLSKADDKSSTKQSKSNKAKTPKNESSKKTNRKIKIIDGDSFILLDKEIRLSGIDAPELKQKCINKTGKYNCGFLSKKKLTELVSNKIICYQEEFDIYKREVATCLNGEININAEMVRSGWAVSYNRYSNGYPKAEKQARRNRAGMWIGDFQKPEKFRRANRFNKKKLRGKSSSKNTPIKKSSKGSSKESAKESSKKSARKSARKSAKKSITSIDNNSK